MAAAISNNDYNPLNPITYSRYQNDGTSCFFSVMFGFFQKPINPLVEELLGMRERLAIEQEQQLPPNEIQLLIKKQNLINWIIGYYYCIHQPKNNTNNRIFKNYLKKMRIFLSTNIDAQFDFINGQQDASEVILATFNNPLNEYIDCMVSPNETADINIKPSPRDDCESNFLYSYNLYKQIDNSLIGYKKGNIGVKIVDGITYIEKTRVPYIQLKLTETFIINNIINNQGKHITEVSFQEETIYDGRVEFNGNNYVGIKKTLFDAIYDPVFLGVSISRIVQYDNENVDLKEFIKTEFDFTNKKNIGEMELCGIIVHSGSYMMPEKSKSNSDKSNKRVVYTVNGGHYVVYFKNNDKWYLYNDLGATISLLEEDPTANKEVKKNCTFLVYFKKNADAAGENSTMTKIRNDEIFMDFIQEQLQIINEELAPGTSSSSSQLEDIKKAENEKANAIRMAKSSEDRKAQDEAEKKKNITKFVQNRFDNEGNGKSSETIIEIWEKMLQDKSITDINVQDSNLNNFTALIYQSAKKGAIIAFEWLLSHNADPNIQDNKGNTSLIYAVDLYDPNKIKLLLDYGADLNKVDKDGKTQLQIIEEINENKNFISALKSYKPDVSPGAIQARKNAALAKFEKDRQDRLAKQQAEAKEKAYADMKAKEIALAENKQIIERQNRVKDFYNKLNQNTYTTIQINKIYETKLTAQNAINKDTNTNIFNFDTKDIGKEFKVGMLILLIHPSQEADDNDVYMIKGFGSIIVDRNFEKDYPENSIIIFYSVEKQERANIITELLKKYNEEYDVEIEKKYEEIKNIQEKSSTKYNENLFRQILIDVDKTQKHIENVKIDFVFNENIKPVNITEMNFIQDINLVEKFVKYRKLEIMKHVRTINYTVEVYKLLSYLIDFEDIINQSITDVKNIYTIKKIDGVNLLNQHKKCKDTLDDIVINNSAFFLNTTLCRFKELEIKLSEIKKRIQIEKDK